MVTSLATGLIFLYTAGMIKALVFDVSGVLTEAKFSEIYVHVANKLQVPADILTAIFKATLDEQLLGQKGISDLCQAVQAVQPHITEAAFRDTLLTSISELSTVNTALLELIDAWRTTYTCGILTNNTEGRALYDTSINLHAHFDFVLESYKEGKKKPDPTYFLLAAQYARCTPAEIIYIDDQQRHADAATTLGMHGLVFTSNDALLTDINTILQQNR